MAPFEAAIHMTKANRPLFYGWIVAAACSFAVSALGFVFSFGVFYKPLMNQFGWKAADVALAPSIFGLVYIAAVFPVSWAYQRYSIKPITLLGGLLMGAGLALSSLTTSLWQLYLFYGVLGGIGSSTIWVPFTSTIMKWFSRRRGVAMAIALSGQGLGSVVIAPSLSYVILTSGWRTAFLLAGASTFLIISSSVLLTKGSPGEMGLRPYGQNQDNEHWSVEHRNKIAAGDYSIREALHMKPFWLLYSLWFFSHIVATTYTQHIVLFAIGIGIPLISASLVLGTIGLTSVAGNLTVGFLQDRIGLRRALVFCYSLTLASAVVLLSTRSMMWLFLFAAAYGFSFGGRTTLEVPLASSFFGLANLGTVVGALETAFGVGGFIGPYLAGRVYDITGRYSEVLLYCAVLSTLTLAIATAIKPSTTHS